jgi:DNA polymerase-1
MKKKLLIVDGMNLMHRGHWSMAKLSSKKGIKTGAIKGFFGIMLADMKELEITHVAVVFDGKGPNFRHKLYPEYKANRKELKTNPDYEEMIEQVPYVIKVLKSLGIPTYKENGIEGDDIIGCIAYQLQEKFDKIYISSSDKDFASLINEVVHLVRNKGEIIDRKGVIAKWGVKPEQMVDYLALQGDKVDNIAGVKKVGAKTAAKLLKTYGDLPTIYKNRKSFSKKMRENFEEARPRLPLNRKLITLDVEVFDVKIKDVKQKEPNVSKFKALCKELDFKKTKTDLERTFLS